MHPSELSFSLPLRSGTNWFMTVSFRFVSTIRPGHENSWFPVFSERKVIESATSCVATLVIRFTNHSWYGRTAWTNSKLRLERIVLPNIPLEITTSIMSSHGCVVFWWTFNQMNILYHNNQFGAWFMLCWMEMETCTLRVHLRKGQNAVNSARTCWRLDDPSENSLYKFLIWTSVPPVWRIETR